MLAGDLAAAATGTRLPAHLRIAAPTLSPAIDAPGPFLPGPSARRVLLGDQRKEVVRIGSDSFPGTLEVTGR